MATNYDNLILQVPAEFAERATDLLARLHDPDEHRCHPDAIINVARKHRLQLIVLFGSHSTGRANGQSDIDVGALPLIEKRFDLLKFFRDISPILNRGNVDVVNLRDAPDLLNWNISQEGIPLYTSDDAVWDRYRINALKRYEDTRRLNRFKLMSIDRFLAEQGLR